MASIRRLEAQLAQEKFFHEKSKAEQQQEIKVKCTEFDSYFSFQTTLSLPRENCQYNSGKMQHQSP